MTEFAQPQPEPERQPEPRPALPPIPATRNLLLAIFAGFAFEVVTGAWRDPHLLVQWAVIGELVFEEGEYWRLLTAMFLHGDGTVAVTIVHLLVNALTLLQLGFLYESRFGTARLTFVYFVSGIAASLTSAYFNAGASVGASGAIFGIVGAFITSVRRSPKYRKEKSARQLAMYFVFWTVANVLLAIQLPTVGNILGTEMPNIDMSAHLGGLVAGLILGALLPHPPVAPPPPSQAVIDVESRPYDLSRGSE